MLIVGIGHLLTTLIADICYALLNQESVTEPPSDMITMPVKRLAPADTLRLFAVEGIRCGHVDRGVLGLLCDLRIDHRASRSSSSRRTSSRARARATCSAPTASAATSSRLRVRDILAAPLVPSSNLGGTILGLVTAYYRGLVDDVIGRIIDTILSIPVVIIAVVALVALGGSRPTIILVIGVVFTPIVARTIRAAALSERELDYVQAAQLRKERGPYMMFGWSE